MNIKVKKGLSEVMERAREKEKKKKRLKKNER
jgi:hypothetical protein